MADVSDDLVDELAEVIVEAMGLVSTRIPMQPAAVLGRLSLQGTEVGRTEVAGESWSRSELNRFGSLLPERLLGALELTIADMDVARVTDLDALVARPKDGTMFMSWSMSGSGETSTAVNRLEGSRPGALDLVVSLTARLSDHPTVVPLLTPQPKVADEAGVAAAHGSAYFALSVCTALTVLRSLTDDADPATVTGVALIAAGRVLRNTSMPRDYAQAQLDKMRAEYLYPRYSNGRVTARDHRFALTEYEFPAVDDFADNGLVAVTQGGVVVRTGTADAAVAVQVQVLRDPPSEVDVDGWDEVVEVSYTASRGLASVIGAVPSSGSRRFGSLTDETPPWPGDYRMRVHASNRDDADGTESYVLSVWQAPAVATLVHKRTDRLGYQLRGDTEPPVVVKPEAVYRWVERSSLAEAATITIVAGTDADAVLRNFGADPDAPEPMEVLDATAMERGDPWLATVSTPDAVIVVEYNGYEGSNGPVLQALSRDARAASLFWNVNAVTRLSFAEHGQVVAAFELGEECTVPELQPMLLDLDFSDYRDRIAKGLVAVERFTGGEFAERNLERLESAGIGFAVLPLLEALYPEPLLPDGSRSMHGSGPLGPDTDDLVNLTAAEQRAVAWWAAEQTAAHFGLGKDPDITETVAAQSLTPTAQLRARKSRIGDREHYWMWSALHQATNPDPLAAAIRALDAARFAFGVAAADFIDRAHTYLSPT